MEYKNYKNLKEDRFNMIVILIVAILIILTVIISNLLMEIGIVSNLIMCWIFTTAYSIFAFFMVSTPNFVEVKREIIKEVPIETKVFEIVERPVYVNREVIKEVPIQIPIENKVIEVVEKPVIQEVPIYIERPRKKISIPKYEFVGSSETKTYHKRSCRFSKLIKKKYKLNSNSKEFFNGRKFKKCQNCLK